MLAQDYQSRKDTRSAILRLLSWTLAFIGAVPLTLVFVRLLVPIGSFSLVYNVLLRFYDSIGLTSVLEPYDWPWAANTVALMTLGLPYAGCVVALRSLLFRRRHALPVDALHCRNCGYPISRSLFERCPECGESTSADRKEDN